MNGRHLWIAAGCILLTTSVALGDERPRTDLYGDPLPEGAIARLGTVRLRQGRAVFWLRFSSDSRKLFSFAFPDRTLRTWDAATGKELQRFTVDQGNVHHIVCSADGKRIAWEDRDGVLRIIDLPSKKERCRVKNPNKRLSLWPELSHDGRWLALTEDDSIHIWDVAAGKEHARLAHTGNVIVVAFSADSTTLVSWTPDDTVRVWDVAEKKELWCVKNRSAVALSPDGKLLALGGDDQSLRLHAVSDGKELRQWKTADAIVSKAAFSGDGRMLATASHKKPPEVFEHTVQLWDVGTGRELRRLSPVRMLGSCFALSPDGKKIAEGDWGEKILLRDTTTGKQITPSIGHHGIVVTAAFTDDENVLLTAGREGRICRWDIATMKEMHVEEKQRFDLDIPPAFSPDRRHVYVANPYRVITQLDVKSGKELQRFSEHEGGICGIAGHPSGKMIASASHDGTTRIWDVASGKVLYKMEHGEGTPYQVAFSPDGKTVFAGGHLYGSVQAWDIARQKFLGGCQGPLFIGSHFAVAPNGKILATGEQGAVRLWDIATGKESAKLVGHQSDVGALAFSHDGKFLATGSGDKTIRLWDIAKGKEILRLTGHEAWVKCLAFSPSDRRLASGSADTTVLVWDLTRSLPGQAPTKDAGKR